MGDPRESRNIKRSEVVRKERKKGERKGRTVPRNI